MAEGSTRARPRSVGRRGKLGMSEKIPLIKNRVSISNKQATSSSDWASLRSDNSFSVVSLSPGRRPPFGAQTRAFQTLAALSFPGHFSKTRGRPPPAAPGARILPLFAEAIAEEQLRSDDVMASRATRLMQQDRNDRALRAAIWREARRKLVGYGDDIRPHLLSYCSAVSDHPTPSICSKCSTCTIQAGFPHSDHESQMPYLPPPCFPLFEYQSRG